MDDEERFREFVRNQWAPLLRTAYLLTGDRGTAEDLVQSALEKTHRRWTRILRTDAPEVYVRRVMVNTASSWWRRRRPIEVPLVASDGGAGADAYLQIEQRQQLLAALRRLPPRTQAVLVLRYFEDRSEAETARVLGCSVGSVKSQASRGLARLRLDFADTPPARLQEDPC
ncbi:SigE family RNA polymerase sigma factor [Asanoa sp. WMMD1127]|uniref:SigE family RNA polymerase sigma factor n=1 Tax=Asanoa sp. WMMD1127 TaxID=3016107 RepID=UPI0024168167|nr:SigE family RNA polymerase sigma factor [Asanoa sp. WMMD1127]MDG4827334.1 SigE family RNA polymerase sigma factor [Asanoa sp. WMMD1127]